MTPVDASHAEQEIKREQHWNRDADDGTRMRELIIWSFRGVEYIDLLLYYVSPERTKYLSIDISSAGYEANILTLSPSRQGHIDVQCGRNQHKFLYLKPLITSVRFKLERLFH